MGNLTAKTSGEIASFMSPAKTNIKSLKVHFSPKQLGEGDPSPDNVREIEGWDGVEADEYNSDFKFIPIVKSNTSLGVTWTINDSGLVIAEGTPTSWSNCLIGYIKVNGDETIQGFIYGSLNNVTISKPKLYDSDDKGISFSASDNILSHGLDLSQYKDVKKVGIVLKRSIDNIYMSGSCYVVVKKIENINDIHKTTIPINWTKNIKQWTYIDATIDDSYSSNNFNGYGNGRWDNVIADIPSEWFGKELTYSAYIERSSSPLNNYDDVRVWCYGDSTTLFDAKNAQRFYDANDSGRSWVTFTIPEGTTKIGLGLYLSKGSRAYNPQLEYGSEPTEYQPYVGTVYGGYVDLINGELVEEWKYLNLDNLEWYTTSQVSVFRSGDLTNYYVSNITNFICNKYTTTSRASTSITNMQDLNIKAHDVNDTYIYIKNTNYTDVAEFKSNLIDCNMVYLLQNPITHQLTPTQLKSFVGQNNFWSNADYVEIEYDLIETEDIQKCRKKIMLNQPHIESVKGDLVNFNTDLRAPLKECKIYFNPIQEGSGDPSPDNVRNITGWDGVEVNGCGKNLWNNEDIIYGYWTDSNGKQSINQKGCRTQYIYVTSNTTIQLFYYGVQPYSASIIELNYNKDFIKRTHIAWEGVTNPKSLTITTSNETRYIYAQTYTYTSGSNNKMTYDILCSYKMQMEFNTITSYEPYKGNIYSEDWSSEVDTVYGGYVDLVKGELVATHVIFEKKWSEYLNNYAMTDVNRRSILFPYERRKIGAVRALCNIASPAHDLKNKIHFYIAPENNYIYMFLPKDLDEETLIQVASRIEEPIHYSLTPQQLLTFKGENNIWSDTNGQTEVKFWTH